MSVLTVNEYADFNTLKELLGATDGNLASHTKSLEKVDFIKVEKQFIGRKPNTKYISRLKRFYRSKNFITNEVIYFQFVHYGFFSLVKHFIGVILIILYPKLYYKLSKFK